MVSKISKVLGASTLASLAGLHLDWGAGISWPETDRAALANVVTGTSRMPGAKSCLAVASTLGAASAIVSGLGGRRTILQAAGVAISAAFLARGIMGLTALTGWLVPWTPGPVFVRLDRQFYGPLCIGVGLLVAITVF